MKIKLRYIMIFCCLCIIFISLKYNVLFSGSIKDPKQVKSIELLDNKTLQIKTELNKYISLSDYYMASNISDASSFDLNLETIVDLSFKNKDTLVIPFENYPDISKINLVYKNKILKTYDLKNN